MTAEDIINAQNNLEIRCYFVTVAAARRIEMEGCLGCPFYRSSLISENGVNYCLSEKKELPEAKPFSVMVGGDQRKIPLISPPFDCIMQDNGTTKRDYLQGVRENE